MLADPTSVYEAHILTKAGEHLSVEVGKDFTVTGVEQHGPGGPGGHHWRPNDNDADDAASPSTSTTG